MRVRRAPSAFNLNNQLASGSGFSETQSWLRELQFAPIFAKFRSRRRSGPRAMIVSTPNLLGQALQQSPGDPRPSPWRIDVAFERAALD